jgi:hypothetical protein
METTNDLVTFDPVDQVSVQATGMTKPQDSEWKFNMENQMKEMMASLKAIGEQLKLPPLIGVSVHMRVVQHPYHNTPDRTLA